MRLRVQRGSVVRLGLLLVVIVEFLLPAGGALAATPSAPARLHRRSAQRAHDVVAAPLRHAQGPASRDAAATPLAPVSAPPLAPADESVPPDAASVTVTAPVSSSAPVTTPDTQARGPSGTAAPTTSAPGSCTSVGPNLVLNGDFETPRVDPTSFQTYPPTPAPFQWTVDQNTIDLLGGTRWYGANNHEGAGTVGDQAVDLSGSTGSPAGSLVQTVPTQPGRRYCLSFYLAGNEDGAPVVKQLEVFFNGVLLDAPTFDTTGQSGTNMGWVRHSYVVTAGAGASADLRLASLTDSYYGPVVDDVSLTAAASGALPWHAQHTTRFDDHLSASVDLADGHVDVNASALSVPGRGPSLAVNHVWDSTLAQAGVTSTAGQGWVSSLTPSMNGVLTQTVSYTDVSGAVWAFPYAGSLTATAPYTAYQTPPGLPWQLSTSSSGYTLTNILSSAVMTFTAQGAYSGEQDAYGNSTTLSYGPNGPTTETNSGGRTLAFSYTNGLLSEAASPLWQGSGGTQGQHVTYGYSGTQLTTQTLGAGTTDALTTTFGYSGTQLISVTTPFTQATHTWSIIYDPYGRVSSIVSPISGTVGQSGYTPAITTTFTYTVGQTQVIEGAGSSAPLTTTYTLDAQGEPITVTDGLGDATGYSYDADHDVVSTTDALSHTTSTYYQYVGAPGPSGLGSTGLVTETVRPAIAAYAPGGTLYPVTTTNVYSPTTNDLLQSSDSEGRLTVYTYDGHHGVLTTTDRLCSNAGSQTTCGAYTPPSAPPRLRPFRPFDQSVTYLRRGTISSYDPYGERVTSIDGRGVYVPSDGVAQPGDAQTVISSTHSYTYTAQGDLAAEGTPPIVTTLGGVTSTAPVTTSYGYDLDGNQISLTSANNAGTSNATTYGYDHLGRAISTTLPPVLLSTGITATPVMTTGYDGEGNVVQQVDGNGDVTLSSDDPLGRLVASTNPVHGTTLYTYTATEQAAQQDAQGHVTTYAYDPAGRLVLSSDPLTDTVQTQYDAVGNPITLTTGTPTTTTQLETRQYDALNAVMTDTISGPGSPAQTTYTYYDTAGRVFQVQQPNGDVTLNSYYFTGELYQQQVYPGAVAAMSGPTYVWMNYDDAGNLIERIDADGRDTLLSVDGADRIVQQVAGPVGSTPTLSTTTGYDPGGNTVSQIVTSTSPVAATRSYTAALNAADWTISSSDKPMVTSPALVTQYSYDAAGQQRGQTILNSASTPVTTTLDAEGRTTAIGEGLNTSSPYTTTYGYNANDLPISATLPNGVQTTLGYDPDSRLITTTAIGPTGVVTPLNNSYSYGYNPSGWTTAITSMVSGLTATNVITHDALGRMVMGNASGKAQSWTYDGNGNLLRVTNPTNTTTYSYTAAITPNEVLTTTSTSGVTTTFGYDQNGDTTGISSTTGVSTNLSYDSQARLSAVRLADGTTVVLAYNAQGQRVAYNVSKGGLTSEAEQLTYRGDALAQAVISNTLHYTDTYLYDPTGAPLELLRQTKSGGTLTTARYWYVLNGHGDVVALTDVTGTVVDSYSYDLWGRLASANEAVPQRLRYAGYWYDVELGWYWVSVREYSPTLMRWLQPDPSQQDGVRTYVYVGDDPVDATDPSGLNGSVSVGDSGTLLDNVVTFVIVGAAAVVAIAATPEILVGAGIAALSTVVIGGITYTVVHTQIGYGGKIVVPAYTPQQGDVQSTQVTGGTTVTLPVQVTLPTFHSSRKIKNLSKDTQEKGRPRSNVDQNRQFKDAVKKLERLLGRVLTDDEQRELHDALHDEGNPGYDDIVEIGLDLFQ